MNFKAKRFDELNIYELYEIMRARNEVFVIEQDCIYQDCDDCDYGYHVFCEDEDGKVSAYMRIYEIRNTPVTVQMGRVLTIKRGQGYGGPLLREGIRVAREKMNAEVIFLEAETDVIGYYEKEGFKVTSGEYLKDGIPHKDMELR